MKYFLPDSQDLVDPSFDFEKENRSVDRVRHQDDHYAHEVFSTRAFDGILISKAIVDGTGGAGQAKYTQAQKRRILREGVRAFFRTEDHRWGSLTFMGDCGAFSYVKAEAPPYTVDEVIEFYEKCGFDYGISVDHVILEYRPSWDDDLLSSGDHGVPAAIRQRQELTLELASEFYKTVKRNKLRFTPVGVVQGWSPRSFANAAKELQKIGYRYIALGGMVPLKTPDILSCLKAVHPTRKPDTQLHLLGVTRLAQLAAFAEYGVVSFDSTSPLRQAFMDDKDNYYTLDRTYTAVRVPQVQGNFRLEARIRSGEIDQDVARKAEQRCLQTLAEYDAGKRAIKTVLEALRAYELIHDPRTDRTEIYREVLEARPWKQCPCEVCKQLKHHVILFRGAERNRRRGFHNVWVFYQRLARGLGGETQIAEKRSPRARAAASPSGTAAPHRLARYTRTRVAMSPRADFITIPATEIKQSKNRKIYSFVVDGKQIHSFATVSRLKRGTDTKLDGYQRPEVLSHIDEIRSYLESPSPMIPNGIVLAFDSSVKFTPAQSTRLNTAYSTMGTLTIPTPRDAADPKPGFIVDGQQRAAAIREADIRQFPMVVTAFITDDIARQTEQFILVNSTKPLPKGLLYKLLPYTEARLPPPSTSAACRPNFSEALNHTPHSPFHRLIQTPTSPKGLIKDNSILRMLDQSLTDGVLFHLRRAHDGEANLPAMTEVLFAFWWAVHDVFEEAWSLPPRKSRLMHGAGIISVGNLMDHIGMPRPPKKALRPYYVEHLSLLKSSCAWTEGTWKCHPTHRRWNDIQNTRQDVALLTDFLQREYDTLRRS